MNINLELILDKFLNELIPITEINVLKGNKIFGALILNKKDYSTITLDTNNEISNPLFHGEISTINSFFSNNNKIKSSDCLFISSHEPCSLCLSAITWSGFNNFFYFFPYEDTENQFNIPHDLKILEEVFNIKNGNYNRDNKYWKSYSILEEITKSTIKNFDDMDKKIKKIKKKYKNLSQIYQKNKLNNKIPLN
tara:strand:+ start:2262 stop:2843 length:582 start_codon:yes stop_codon:yes gene_type:complete